MSEEAIEILRYARDVVLDAPDKWWQGSWHSPDGNSVCAWAAIDRARDALGYSLSVGWVAQDQLDLVSPTGRADDFNDGPGTTYEDVIDLFDAAIKVEESA